MFTLAELEAAHDRVSRIVAPTPQYNWPLLSEAAGLEVWVKHENHTPIGAFKVRGGLEYMNELAGRRRRPNGVITASRGNHGQSIPFAARQFGVPVTVLVPHGNSAEKDAAMRAWGATVETFGNDFDTSREEAQRRAASQDLEFVPSYHPFLVLGVATYARELFTGVADLDVVYVPIGMGSGIAGLIRVRDLLGLGTAIVGVVSSGAPAFARSFAAGRIEETHTARTFADGVACRVPHPDAFDVILRGAARIVQVSDDEVAEAIRLLYRTTHNVAEGAGAAACAALMKEKARLRGRRAAIVMTGGNIDTPWLVDVLSGRTPEP